MPQPTIPLEIVDPRLIPQSDTPLLVLSNQTNSIVAGLINFRTHIQGMHPYDHAMLCIDEGKFVLQDYAGYNEVSMDRYLIKGGELAFVQLVNSNAAFVKAFSKSVQKRLLAPWWQKQYDWLGIFGQAIGQEWIHTPGLEYCSVDVIRHLVNACPNLPKEDQDVINNIPRESNPESFWRTIINNPGTFYVCGTWDSDNGVVV